MLPLLSYSSEVGDQAFAIAHACVPLQLLPYLPKVALTPEFVNPLPIYITCFTLVLILVEIRGQQGCVLIACWGVPGRSYPDNGNRCLAAAVEIHASLQVRDMKSSMGITTGHVRLLALCIAVPRHSQANEQRQTDSRKKVNSPAA